VWIPSTRVLVLVFSGELERRSWPGGFRVVGLTLGRWQRTKMIICKLSHNMVDHEGKVNTPGTQWVVSVSVDVGTRVLVGGLELAFERGSSKKACRGHWAVQLED